jgi:hypothetical protein
MHVIYWYLSNVDTFGTIQSVLISVVISYIICAFGTNKRNEGGVI